MTRTALAALLLAVAANAAGQLPPARPFPDASALEMGSLRIDPTDGGFGLAAGWTMSLTTSYFNLWKGTWHTVRLHQDSGRVGQETSHEEVAELQRLYPGRTLYRIDAEGWRADLVTQWSNDSGFVVTARIPWIEFGTPHWDHIAEDVHSLLNFATEARDLYPRGSTFIYVQRGDGAALAGSEMAHGMLGDIALSASMPVAELFGARQRASLVLELPTGGDDSPFADGGLDAGLRVFSEWTDERHRFLLGLGYTYLDSSGSFFGLERASGWHLLAEYQQPFWRRIELRATAKLESPILGEHASMDLDDPVLYVRLGVGGPLGRNRWWAFDLGENFPILGIAADWSFGFEVGQRWP